MMPVSWKDLEEGSTTEPMTIGPISRTDIVRYQGASGDMNPIHHDEPFATGSMCPADESGSYRVIRTIPEEAFPMGPPLPLRRRSKCTHARTPHAEASRLGTHRPGSFLSHRLRVCVGGGVYLVFV